MGTWINLGKDYIQFLLCSHSFLCIHLIYILLTFSLNRLLLNYFHFRNISHLYEHLYCIIFCILIQHFYKRNSKRYRHFLTSISFTFIRIHFLNILLSTIEVVVSNSTSIILFSNKSKKFKLLYTTFSKSL